KVMDLADRSISGLGDFLVDGGTGQPFRVEGSLETGKDAWYRFTTLGDGEPGNQIRVLTEASGSGSFELSPPRSDADRVRIHAVAGSVDATTILELDLFSLVAPSVDRGTLPELKLALDTAPASAGTGTVRVELLKVKGDRTGTDAATDAVD